MRQTLKRLCVRTPTGRRQIRSIEKYRGSGLQCVTERLSGGTRRGINQWTPARYSRECVDERGQLKTPTEIAEPAVSARM